MQTETNRASILPQTADAAAYQPVLVLDAPRGRRLVVLEEGRSLHIGRWRADITIEDHTLSRRHAAVRVIRRAVQLRDLGSTNGTWLNGERVARCELEPGDLVTLGAVRLRLRWSLPTGDALGAHGPLPALTDAALTDADGLADGEHGHEATAEIEVSTPIERADKRAANVDRLLATPLNRLIARYQRDLIRAALLRTRGNQTAAAALIQLPRRTLIHKLAMLEIDPRRPLGEHGECPEIAAAELDDRSLTFKQRVDALERRVVVAALARAAGIQRRAAELLGITVHALAYKLRKHALGS